MNKIYKVIWSKVKNQYVVVSELAHSSGKQSRTSKSSIRSRIAALVVCGAVTAFGVYGALPANSVFAAAAATVAGQYIAVAVDANNQGRYSIGDTRTFEDAQGKTHNYTWVNVDGKNYWVREGYSITIENGSRFTAYDKWGNPIAPDNTYIIDSQKSDSADSEGLISSSQVVIGDDSAHTTLTGNKLNSIDAGIYGGAVNTGGTQVPSSFNYYINDNGNGWKDVGGETSVSSMDNFKKVYKMADGTYNTDRRGKGTTVSTDNLYVIDGELGAFFNSNGSVYTGNVYGHNNEVLMTGVDKVNGNYYSYWGTEINDPNTSLSEMTVGDLKKIVGGINDTIYTAQGDDIKQVSVQKSGDNGGTIGLIRRGDWNGTTYEETDPVPGTITVTSTGGTEGKDVAIQFANDQGSFTVDAGSKVEATKFDENEKVSELSINGKTYAIGGGETYTAGNGIAIDDKNDNKISVVTGNGLGIEDGKVVAKAGTNVTIDENGINAKDTTLVGGEITPTTSEDGYENTYNISDTDGNTATLKDVASATKLSSVDSKVGDTQYASNNYITDGENLTTTAGKLDAAIKDTTDKVNTGWTATDGTTNIGVNPTNNTLKFTGDKNINVTADKANSTINVELDPNLEVTSVTATGSVNAGGTTISSTGLAVGGKTYVSSDGINANDQKIKNVVAGTDEKDAVNVGQLKSYVSDNATYTEGDGININDKVISVDTGNGLGIKDGKVVAKAGTNVTIDENGINAKDTTLVGGEITPTTSEDGYENTYNISDTDGNTATLKDVASATKLSSVDSKVGDTQYASNNYITDGENLTTAASNLDAAIKDTTNKVDAGWTATDGSTNIAVNPTNNTLKFAGDKNIAVTAETDKDGNNSINVALSDNLDVANVKASGDVVTTDEKGEVKYSLNKMALSQQMVDFDEK